MARYRATVEAGLEPADAFAYLSDFSNTQEWDPGVTSATRLDSGPVAAGSEFRVVVSFMGRTMPLTYRIAEFEPRRRVVLVCETDRFRSRDEITVAPDTRGCRVTYDADIAMKGLFRLSDPLMSVVFKRTGDKAVAGLRETLARRASERAS